MKEYKTTLFSKRYIVIFGLRKFLFTRAKNNPKGYFTRLDLFLFSLWVYHY